MWVLPGAIYRAGAGGAPLCKRKSRWDPELNLHGQCLGSWWYRQYASLIDGILSTLYHSSAASQSIVPTGNTITANV